MDLKLYTQYYFRENIVIFAYDKWENLRANFKNIPMVSVEQNDEKRCNVP